MRVIYADDEKLQLENFRLLAKGIKGIDCLNLFSDGREVYKWLEKHPVDVAFLDIEMPFLNGVELAKRLRKLNRRICIIFVTAYDGYALQALKVRPNGFLLKPYTKKDIEVELENASFILNETVIKKIKITTMPDLLVTVNGRSVFEGHSKQEELFALLVDRGKTGVTKGDAFACLWEEKMPSDSTYWTCLYRLKKMLEEAGISKLLITRGNTKYIDTEQVECDLYQMLDGNEEIINRYVGNYLKRYSWAEERIPQLDAIKKSKK